MNPRIDPVHLGFDTCYLVRGEGTVLIDAGAPKQVKTFRKALERLSVSPQEIRLIVITHGHYDHIGSAKEIKEMTGAKIAMHHRERGWLEHAVKPFPPGVNRWGRIVAGAAAPLMRFVHFPPATVDIVLEDEAFALDAYGILGQILHTPGHSLGSVSVLLESGDAFVGDAAMNGLPLRFGPGLPIFAEDMGKLQESWRLLLDRGARTIYPAHGRPFAADVMRKSLR